MIAITDLFSKGTDEMKMRIFESIDDSLDRLTVEDICQRAGISRQTFYRNFDSKFEVVSWHGYQCGKRYLSRIGREVSWEIGYRLNFSAQAEYRDQYCAGLQYTGKGPFGSDMLVHYRRDQMLAIVRELINPAELPIMERVVAEWARCENEVACEWYKAGLPDPREFAAMLALLVPNSLHDLFNDAAK